MEEKNIKFYEMKMNLRMGDIITSQKGIGMESELTGKKYLVKKLQVEAGYFTSLKKEEIILKGKPKKRTSHKTSMER